MDWNLYRNVDTAKIFSLVFYSRNVEPLDGIGLLVGVFQHAGEERVFRDSLDPHVIDLLYFPFHHIK
jgi:hypothetical protein